MKHVLANKARWDKLSEQEKSDRMSKISHGRWDKMSHEDKKKVGLSLVAARNKKTV